MMGIGADTRIALKGGSMRFGAFQVFVHIDLEIDVDEIVTVAGPSGCGKTTLPSCIDGLIPCDGSSIVFDGTQVRALREGVAMVFEHFDLFPWDTSYNNVGYGLKLAGASYATAAQWDPTSRRWRP